MNSQCYLFNYLGGKKKKLSPKKYFLLVESINALRANLRFFSGFLKKYGFP